MSQVLSHAALRRLVDAWLRAGKRVWGPTQVKPGCVLYQPLHGAEQLLLTGFVRPANSIKEAVFPRHEKLFHYRLTGKQIELTPAEIPDVEQIVLAARPCDAAALPVLDHVFNWDSHDVFYNRRRELTTIVTLACSTYDAQCFCTSVGGGPDDPAGSDALLFDLGEGAFEVRCLTEKGQAALAAASEPSERVGAAGEAPPKRADLKAVQAALERSFERAEWSPWTMRCQGCGACAFSCPTCHCFDMVDEGGPAGGARGRNWDACQFGLFTLHASGHNPRAAQQQRQRQRMHHKFQVYPQKFGAVLCTGCGNCTRNCPVSLGVLPVLTALEQAEPQESR